VRAISISLLNVENSVIGKQNRSGWSHEKGRGSLV
jgi:hypothetical protein